jgi:hypothetical protein
MLDIKPLTALGVRKLKTAPPHFARFQINDFDNHDDQLESWIEDKLNGRYFILKIPAIENNRLKNYTYVGFENHKELTYLILSCPFIRRK